MPALTLTWMAASLAVKGRRTAVGMTERCPGAPTQEEGWICNSSICMTKRGLKPTGIAIFEAQGKGFASVGHYVQVAAQRALCLPVHKLCASSFS